MGKIIILFLSFSFLFTTNIYCASKEELLTLKQQAAKKEAELKKYQETQKRLQKELQKLTQKEKATVALASKISDDINEIQSKTSILKTQQELMQESMPLWQFLLKKQFITYFIEKRLENDYLSDYAQKRNLILKALLDNDIAYLTKVQKNLEKNEKDLTATEQQHETLLDKQIRIEAEQKTLQETHKETDANLKATKEQLENAQKALKELNKSAKELEKILRKAERQRQLAERQKGKNVAKTPTLNIPKHSLSWPVKGQIISKFGKEYNNNLKTYIFRDGIKISAKLGTPIVAVDGGKVIFAGDFRSYGKVVILDHDGAFFTIYGFLDEIRVKVGQTLRENQILGTCGKDNQGAEMGSGKNALYFEIRAGTQAIDPIPWLE